VLSPGSSESVLLLSKVALSAGFTLGGTAAVERLGPRVGGLVAAVPQLAVASLIFFAIEPGRGSSRRRSPHYGHDVVKPFIKIFRAGIFGVCLFNLVAWLSLERLGLASTIVLGYGVDIAYLATVAWARGRSR
jgi:drug/metabolite transporter (DMT)-like permease